MFNFFCLKNKREEPMSKISKVNLETINEFMNGEMD
jgi:hypothetical protein